MNVCSPKQYLTLSAKFFLYIYFKIKACYLPCIVENKELGNFCKGFASNASSEAEASTANLSDAKHI